MSSTGTRTHTEVGTEVEVGAWTATYSFVANETATFLLNYLDHRGLGVDRLVDVREDLEDAIWTYLSSGHLTKVFVEVYPQGGGELVERFDVAFETTAPDEITSDEAQRMNERKFQSYHESIMAELREFDPPPDGCTYRIMIGYRGENDHGEGPPALEGWDDEPAMDTSHLDRRSLGDAIDAGSVDGSVELWI